MTENQKELNLFDLILVRILLKSNKLCELLCPELGNSAGRTEFWNFFHSFVVQVL